jgi:hypothetical protein
MALPIISEIYEVASGGASNPRILAGVVDPSAGGGVAAPEGSLYLRFVSAAGETWYKSSTGDTDWTLSAAGGGPSATVFSKVATFGVGIGVSTQEATTGRVTYDGSLAGLSIHDEEATVAGTLTVNVKVNGVTKLTAFLESVTNTEYNFATATVGTHPLLQGDEITVEVIGDGAYDNTPSGVAGIVVNVTHLADGVSVVDPSIALLDAPQTFTAGQVVAQVTLADGAAIAVDGDASINFELELTEDSDIVNPINVVPGMSINFAVRQDVTGGWALTFDTAFKFSAPLVIPAVALDEFMISCYVRAAAAGVATVMLCSVTPAHV